MGVRRGGPRDRDTPPQTPIPSGPGTPPSPSPPPRSSVARVSRRLGSPNSPFLGAWGAPQILRAAPPLPVPDALELRVPHQAPHR